MNAWREQTTDPNDAELMRHRQQLLAKARNPQLISDRVAYLCNLVDGRKVLDIGVVDHDKSAWASDQWLHGRLCQAARECHGVDILEQEAAELVRRGFRVRCHDITEGPLAELFEVIVCGEVLEHLHQTKQFLTNCASMLQPQGLLVITVPNPWYANVVLKNTFGATPFQDNVDHVAWYDASTLYELGARCGLELYRYSAVAVGRAPSLKSRLFLRSAPLLQLAGVKAEFFAKTMIYEFHKRN